MGQIALKVHPNLAQPFFKGRISGPDLEPLGVSTVCVELFHTSDDAAKGSEPLIETFVQVFVRSRRSASGVGFQLVVKIGAIRASLHRNLPIKKGQLGETCGGAQKGEGH